MSDSAAASGAGDGRSGSERAGTASSGAAVVSVIMPVYNAEATLQRSIDSVLGQSHRALELIAVDDGSSDGSAALIEAQARRDGRVRLVRQANAGVAAARNAGIAAATGSHIAFLDSDDWWHPRKLELQLAQMQRLGAQVAYSGYLRVAESGHTLSRVDPPAELRYRDLLRSNYIGHLTGIYDRRIGDAAFLEIGHEDYAFWLDRLRRAGRAVRADHDEPLAYYLVRAGSLSSNKLRAARWQWRIYREVERLSLPQAAVYMASYVAQALLKRRPGSA
ncbi:MAG TPA: glycosyltransferase family 2 protein [Dokdonella sp.]|uniref:glycosyltransferase family 2 protein n=1 Tax=Dokdonella sp. TaxID=2291710 RepID=UPI002CE3242A|nr:glycosyltransferase family 2 protein [Dokdonella sp.]HUD43680.1 glycosyltransferase family 2 protein [Dokdonella sp.]